MLLLLLNSLALTLSGLTKVVSDTHAMDQQDSRIRRRHTFLIGFHDTKSIDKFDFAPDGSNVKISGFSGPRQDRISVPLQHQSKEKSLKSVNKLHITWSSDKSFDGNVPFNTVREPGWHINTDLETQWNESGVTSLIRSLRIDLLSSDKPIQTPNWSSLCFSGPLNFMDSALQSLLSQWYTEQELLQATSLSISYGYEPENPNPNQISSDLIIEIYWPNITTSSPLSRTSDKVEVGLLSVNPTYTKNNIWALSGLIRSLDTDTPERTLFDYMPKHIQLPSSYYHGEFETPIGLHPKYEMQLINVNAPQPVCKLYAKYTVPRDLFLDQYQLADLDRSIATPATGKLIGVWGETDLENPVWSAPGWGSEALIQIYLPPASQSRTNFTFTLPLHSRYELPQFNATQVDRIMPWPVVFWACKDLENRVTNDVPGLSYESLYPHDTLFYHLTPYNRDMLGSEFTIPVAPVEVYGVVSHATVAVLIGAFTCLLYKIIARSLALSRDKTKQD